MEIFRLVLFFRRGFSGGGGRMKRIEFSVYVVYFFGFREFYEFYRGV